jgi:hypothetical protein
LHQGVPSGTTVFLDDGTQRSVLAMTLDQSNDSRLAQVLLQLPGRRGPA